MNRLIRVAYAHSDELAKMHLTFAAALPMCVSVNVEKGDPIAGFERIPKPAEPGDPGFAEMQRAIVDEFVALGDPPAPDTLRTELARAFGLASDAPDEVLLDTAKKAWEGVSSAAKAEHEFGQRMYAQRETAISDRNSIADKCGDLEHENKRLRALLGERLVERKL